MTTNSYEALLSRAKQRYEYICKDITNLKALIAFAQAVGQEWQDSGPNRSAYVAYINNRIELSLRIGPEDRVMEAISLVATRCREHGIADPERQDMQGWQWNVLFPAEQRWLKVIVTDTCVAGA